MTKHTPGLKPQAQPIITTLRQVREMVIDYDTIGHQEFCAKWGVREQDNFADSLAHALGIKDRRDRNELGQSKGANS